MTRYTELICNNIHQNIIHWVALTTSKKMQKKTACQKWVLVVTELFNFGVNDFGAKKSAQ